MEMIERYLQAVKFALPQAEREDIVKELRDSILSQIEEKEATLGRPLSRRRTGGTAQETRQPDAAGEPVPETAVPDWSHHVSNLLEGVESLAGDGICDPGGG